MDSIVELRSHRIKNMNAVIMTLLKEGYNVLYNPVDADGYKVSHYNMLINNLNIYIIIYAKNFKIVLKLPQLLLFSVFSNRELISLKAALLWLKRVISSGLGLLLW